ncbi:hypothetical protein CEUSTIGMA_g13864.t1, partial [Chlamydomonas eustigma]
MNRMKAGACGRLPSSPYAPVLPKITARLPAVRFTKHSGFAPKMDTQALLQNIVQSKNPVELLSLYKDHCDVMNTAHLVASMLKLPKLKVESITAEFPEERDAYENLIEQILERLWVQLPTLSPRLLAEVCTSARALGLLDKYPAWGQQATRVIRSRLDVLDEKYESDRASRQQINNASASSSMDFIKLQAALEGLEAVYNTSKTGTDDLSPPPPGRIEEVEMSHASPGEVTSSSGQGPHPRQRVPLPPPRPVPPLTDPVLSIYNSVVQSSMDISTVESLGIRSSASSAPASASASAPASASKMDYTVHEMNTSVRDSLEPLEDRVLGLFEALPAEAPSYKPSSADELLDVPPHNRLPTASSDASSLSAAAALAADVVPGYAALEAAILDLIEARDSMHAARGTQAGSGDSGSRLGAKTVLTEMPGTSRSMSEAADSGAAHNNMADEIVIVADAS